MFYFTPLKQEVMSFYICTALLSIILTSWLMCVHLTEVV